MNTLSRCKPLLGTFVEVSVSANTSDKELIALSNQAFDEIDIIHRLMSFHDETSELSRLNKTAHLKPHMLSKDMGAVLSQALSLSALTDGLFDVSIGQELVAQGSLPNHLARQHSSGSWKDIVLDEEKVFFKKPLLIDLGGIAKGYAVDCALKKLSSAHSALVNAGGDLACTDWQAT
ncbi:MAG: FAD:protein FMN transferase, partial [Parvibaculaceae bacterium]|nr:FAD:protein FMN transferase [Parvibaculaceae bacterium]